MKKTTLARMLSLLLLAAALFTLAACGKKEVDPDAVVSALLKDVKYDDTLSEVGSAASMYFTVPEGTEIQLYMGSGSYADEVAVLSCASEADADQAYDAAKAHITELRGSFANYIPAELDKIDNAVVEKSGKYVFICVTNDYANAKTVLSKAIG